MTLRSVLPLLCLLLSGCDKGGTSLAAVESRQRAAASESGQIICARAGSDAFTRDCSLERTTTADGLVLTLRHADGHFHRFLVTQDGRGVIAADGAELAKVSVHGTDEIEVALAGDRYRLPATVRDQAPPGQ